jgi:hypothetical protein
MQSKHTVNRSEPSAGVVFFLYITRILHQKIAPFCRDGQDPENSPSEGNESRYSTVIANPARGATGFSRLYSHPGDALSTMVRFSSTDCTILETKSTARLISINRRPPGTVSRTHRGGWVGFVGSTENSLRTAVHHSDHLESLLFVAH